MANDISNSDDVIDSRDVIDRIEELEADLEEPSILDAEEKAEAEAELKILRALAEEAADYAADWEHGETLIRDSYFPSYAEELANDCGMLEKGMGWPYNCIDWEKAARELQRDYTAVDFDGVTYWVR